VDWECPAAERPGPATGPVWEPVLVAGNNIIANIANIICKEIFLKWNKIMCLALEID
jgi:hypothetical protein